MYYKVAINYLKIHKLKYHVGILSIQEIQKKYFVRNRNNKIITELQFETAGSKIANMLPENILNSNPINISRDIGNSLANKY